MSLKERIDELFADHPEKRSVDLAKSLGISRSAVTDWRNGNTKEIKGENTFGVARFFGANPEWVQTGKGKKYLDQDMALFSNETNKQFLMIFTKLTTRQQKEAMEKHAETARGNDEVNQEFGGRQGSSGQ